MIFDKFMLFVLKMFFFCYQPIDWLIKGEIETTKLLIPKL